MHTVSELHTFRKSAKKAGMSDAEIEDLIDMLAQNPEAGEEIKGTGGCRKVRVRVKGNNKGKSGGARTITFYSGEDMPVYMLTAFGKGKKINLTAAERGALKKLTEELVDSNLTRVVRLAVGER